MRSWFLMLLLFAAGAQAAPECADEHVQHARLSGQGRYTWFGLSIYDAALWVGERGYQGDAPFALELRYARKLEGARIAQASVDEMAKLNAGSEAQRAAWLARMKEIFPDVRDGTRLCGVYLPGGGGARFYLDGKALATVPDPAFARAFFDIWLAPGTSARTLRTALLKDGAPR
jgi:hypothetical protein